MKDNLTKAIFMLLLCAGVVFSYTISYTNPSYLVNETEYSTYTAIVRNVGGDVTDVFADFQYAGSNYSTTKYQVDANTWQFNITKRNPFFRGYENITKLASPITNGLWLGNDGSGGYSDITQSIVPIDRNIELRGFDLYISFAPVANTKLFVRIRNESGDLEWNINDVDVSAGVDRYFRFTPNKNLTSGIYYFQAYSYSPGYGDMKIRILNNVYSGLADTNIFDTIVLEDSNTTHPILHNGYTGVFNITTELGKYYNSTYHYQFNFSIQNATGVYSVSGTLNYTNITQLLNLTQNVNLTYASNQNIFNSATDVDINNGSNPGTQMLIYGTQSIDFGFNQSAVWGYNDTANDGKNTNLNRIYQGTTNGSRKVAQRYMCPFIDLNVTDCFDVLSKKQTLNCFNSNRTYIYEFNLCSDTNNGGYYCGACTDYSCLKRIMNFSYFDENSLASISANQTVTFTITSPITEITNFTRLTNTSHSYYVYPNFANITVSSFEQYDSTGYSTRNRFYTSAAISNDSQNIYLLPNAYSTYVTIYVIYSNGVSVPGVTVVPLRYFPATNTYTQVAMAKTNDNGVAQAFLRVDNIYYKFAVYDSNNNLLYFSDNPSQITPSGGDYTVTLTIGSQALDYEWLTPYSVGNCYGNNNSNTIIFTYSDLSGKTKSINFFAERNNGTNKQKVFVCNYTINASSGSYICPLSGVEDLNNYTYICTVQEVASPPLDAIKKIIDFFNDFVSPIDWQIVGLMFILCLGTMLAYPAYGVALTGISMLMLDYAGIIAIPQNVSAPIAIVGLILAFLMLEDR